MMKPLTAAMFVWEEGERWQLALTLDGGEFRRQRAPFLSQEEALSFGQRRAADAAATSGFRTAIYLANPADQPPEGIEPFLIVAP